MVYGTRGQKRNTSYYAIQDVLSNDNSPCDTVITEAVYITGVGGFLIQGRRLATGFGIGYSTGKNVVQSKYLFESSGFGKVLLIPLSLRPHPDETGCVNTSGTSPDRRGIKTGSNDDYLHPERFIDPDGNCYCDECGVIFDHRINTKFNDKIIPAIHDSTGIWIDTDLIDFYITMNGQTVVLRTCLTGARMETYFSSIPIKRFSGLAAGTNRSCGLHLWRSNDR